ncbi:unnamed protein product, partial [Brassica napus]
RNVFGRRQRNDSSGIEDVESSSAAQRRLVEDQKKTSDGKNRMRDHRPLAKEIGD